MTIDKLEFMECNICRIKPGSPLLCDSCYHNRRAITRLKDSISTINNFKKRLKEILKDLIL